MSAPHDTGVIYQRGWWGAICHGCEWTLPSIRGTRDEALDEARQHASASKKLSFEAVCSNCGDQFVAPPWEDPEDTLCVPCAEDEQNS